jgi:hypothetical protein
LNGISQAIGDSSVYFYDRGNKAIQEKNYPLADSMFTISLKYLRHPDTYYNRAAVRKKMGNMKGYCIDLGNAANMKDTVANRLFWKNCGKMDTVYYPHIISVDKDNFIYMDIIAKCIYTTDAKFNRFDSKKKLIASWEITNNDTIFYLTPTPPKYPEDESQITENLRYITPNYQSDVLLLGLGFTVLPDGNMEDIKIASVGVDKYYEDQIVKVFKKYTRKWTPGKFEGRSVKYRKTIFWSVKYIEKKYGEK